jgi:glycosyltransferase involved in cell wall biosynthesis
VTKRILYIEANEDGTVGGSHRALYDLVRTMDRSRYEPLVLFYQNNQYVEMMRAVGAEVIVYEDSRKAERELRRNGTRLAKMVENCATIGRRVRFLKSHRIDMVHVNNSPRACNDDWLPATRILGIPCIANVMGDARGPDRGWLQGKLFRSFDHYLTISSYITDAMRAVGIADDRMDLAYLGVDLESFRARVIRERADVRRELAVPDDAVLAVMVGNIREWKGQHVVLAAIEQLAAAAQQTLHVAFVGSTTAGDESYLASLRATVERLGLARQIRFLGGRTDVPDLLNAADIALHASVRPEPFGLVVVEAMALGKAVIAANRGGPAEVLDAEAGVTFDPQLPAQLAASLAGLIEDPARRARLGAGALLRAEQFTVRQYVAGVQKVYERVLAVDPQQDPRLALAS